MKATVAEYINNCLPCKRSGPPSRYYLRQVLSRTEPFQLISLDHVGPRIWTGKKIHYLVIIDHFSRYLVVKPVQSTTTDETVKVLHEEWVMKFGAPEAVLVDRGRAYMSNAFQSYIYDYLAADLVYAGAGYPQGNAINESVHRGLEASITARKQYDASVKYDEILADAVLAYNSTPHSSTGQSPYFLLFGKEMVLPGLQRFKEELPEVIHRARIKEARKIATMRAIMSQDEGLRLYRPATVEVGEQIVFHLKP